MQLLLFGLSRQVDRKTYLVVGLALGVIKYAIDFAVVRLLSGGTWTLAAYLTPSLALRLDALGKEPGPLPWIMLGYALPFAWVGVSMSVRRAADSGISPWWGLGFFVPFANYVLIACLCVLPSKGHRRQDASSPDAHIHPPHPDGYFRSKRGEFRLVPLRGGRARLEGSTWYELDIAPFTYWSLLADAIVHRIHERVLAHVKIQTESD